MAVPIITYGFLTVICLSLVAAGVTHGTQAANEPPIKFQWLDVGPGFEAARVDAVGKAIGFQNWPQTDVRYVAPMIDKSLLLHPELITRELSTYDIVYFGRTPWGICKWSCGHLNENPEPLPTEIPPDRKENLLAHLTPEERDDPNFVEKYLSRKLDSYRQSQKYHLDGSINIWICLAPSSQAAQEYLLHTMTQNSMSTEALSIGYASDKRPEDLGTISFLTESTHKDDIRIKFVRNNICLNIRADGCFATEALPLARKIDAMLLAQQPLTYEQLLARRPVVTISSDVDKVRMNGCRTVSYNISVPSGQDIVCARASCREGQYQAAKDGKITLPDKMGKVKVKLIAITHELLANSFERDVIIPDEQQQTQPK